MKKYLGFLSLTLCFFLLSGCITAGGLKNSDSIRATDIVGEDYLEIKMDVEKYERAGNYCFFSSEKDLEEMKEVFDTADIEVGTLQTEVCGNYLFIQKKNPDGNVHYYYLIFEKLTEEGNRYNFSHAGMSIINENGSTVTFPQIKGKSGATEFSGCFPYLFFRFQIKFLSRK